MKKNNGKSKTLSYKNLVSIWTIDDVVKWLEATQLEDLI